MAKTITGISLSLTNQFISTNAYLMTFDDVGKSLFQVETFKHSELYTACKPAFVYTFKK